MAITCPLCPGLKFSSVKFFFKHLRLTHSDMPNFHIQCNLQGCKRTFRNLKYYQNHIFAHHDTSVLNGSQEVIEQMTTNENPHEESFSAASDEHNPADDSFQESIRTKSREGEVQRAAAMWILKTRECNRIPMSVMDSIIFDVQSLFDVALGQMRQSVETILQGNSIPQGVTEAALSQLNEHSTSANIFHGLETQHQQQKYLRTYFNLVVSYIFPIIYCAGLVKVC